MTGTCPRPPPRLSSVLCGWLAGLACCAAPPEGRDAAQRCQLVAAFKPSWAAQSPDVTPDQAARPELIGSWDGWHRPGLRTWSDQGDWRVATLALPPGVHHYAIVAGDRLFLDGRNPQSAFLPSPLLRGDAPFGAEVSRVVIPDCHDPVLLAERAVGAPFAVRFEASFAPGIGATLLDPGSVRASLRRGQTPLPPPQISLRQEDDGVSHVLVQAGGLPPGKYTLVLEAADLAGRTAAPLRLSSFVEPEPERGLEDGLIYQIVVDRFRGAAALVPPFSPGDRAGGTLFGVQAAITAGYFERLGVTTLWLSPVYQNPSGRLTGRDGHLYEAYHGYWPVAPRGVETRLGGEAGLDAVVEAAHARGLRVILDAVPNHVHQDHPYYQQHSRRAPDIAGAKNPEERSWFNDGPAACVCGGPGCGWGERLEDCWFDRYLPDLNWRHPEVLDAGVADLGFWTARFDLDGFRIDAVPMMPRAAARRMVRGVREHTYRSGLDALVVGETYTGPGDGGRAEIRAFLGSKQDGLDSQFDFPLMWALRSVVAHGQMGFDTLEAEVAASDTSFGGSGAVIAHIAGNHDTTRFISEAAGDAGNDAWQDPPPQPTTAEPYARHTLAMAFLLTLPGLPVLYYGDEVGLAGSGDPDARRPLPDVLSDRLPSLQAEVLSTVARLGRVRRCFAPLRRGTRRVLMAGRDHDVALRQGPEGAALVVLSRAPAEVTLMVAGLPAGRYHDALSTAELTVGSGPTAVRAAPLRPAVYLPAGSPCL